MEAPVSVLKRSRREVEEHAESLLEKVGLADRRDYFPSQLSGGAATAGSHCPGSGHGTPGNAV